MKVMQSFLVFFYILDQGYDQCEEEDLGRFLGTISPELWGDGQPTDKAIFSDWQRINKFQTIDENNIIKTAFEFLEGYEYEFGFEFCNTKKWLITLANSEIIEKAIAKADAMYQKFKYDI